MPVGAEVVWQEVSSAKAAAADRVAGSRGRMGRSVAGHCAAETEIFNASSGRQIYLRFAVSRARFPMALHINDETISDEIIEEEFRHIKGHYERTLQVACCERDPEFRAMAKDNLSSRALLQQESLRRHPQVTEDEISERLAKLMEQAGGKERFFMNLGMPFSEEGAVRENVAGGVRLDKTLNEVYAPEPQPTEQE